jgi:hypothetical protein
MGSQGNQDGYLDPSRLDLQLIEKDGQDLPDRCRPGEVIDEEKQVLCATQQR